VGRAQRPGDCAQARLDREAWRGVRAAQENFAAEAKRVPNNGLAKRSPIAVMAAEPEPQKELALPDDYDVPAIMRKQRRMVQ
jgi:hypothetical protein